MNQYILLLRAVNISGKNHLDNGLMKSLLSACGCQKVISYLNSGNFYFCCSESFDEVRLMIDELLRKKLQLPVNFYLGFYQEVKEMVDDFFDKSVSFAGSYDNIIFPIDASIEAIQQSLGPTSEYDHVVLSDKCLYFSFELANYRKSKWYFSSANCSLSNSFTIRKVSTIKKLIERIDNE
ncbi:MAG: DUF1697 domain-containing protein [Erysipelotrichaceae bacterium]